MKAAQRQFSVTVSTIPERTFSQIEGGEKSSETSRWRDGGSVVADIIAAPSEVADVTLTNAYDPDVDDSLVRSLLTQVGIMTGATITKTPLYGDMTRAASAKPMVYTGCVLRSVTPPAGNSNSGDVATYQLVFTPSDVS